MMYMNTIVSGGSGPEYYVHEHDLQEVLEYYVLEYGFTGCSEYYAHEYDYTGCSEYYVYKYDFTGCSEYYVNEYDFTGCSEYYVHKYDFTGCFFSQECWLKNQNLNTSTFLLKINKRNKFTSYMRIQNLFNIKM